MFADTAEEICSQTTASAPAPTSAEAAAPAAPQKGRLQLPATPQIRTLLDFAAWLALTGSQKSLLLHASSGGVSTLAEDVPFLPDAVRRAKVSAAVLPLARE